MWKPASGAGRSAGPPATGTPRAGVARRCYRCLATGSLAEAPVAEDVVFTCPFPTVRGGAALLEAVRQIGSTTKGMTIETQALADGAAVTVGELRLVKRTPYASRRPCESGRAAWPRST